MGDPEAQEQHDPRVLALKGVLLAVWGVVTFVFSFFARDLQFMVGGWPFGYWVAAQGAVLAFIAIVVVYAICMKRLAPEDSLETGVEDFRA
jgi:putative solute:sodium symporter small subunit